MDSKRHHFVQRAYLERFAEAGKVFVRCRDGRSFKANTTNVAVETGFYDIPGPDGTRSTIIEKHLGAIEDPGMTALGQIDARGRPPSVGTTERKALSRYLGLQATRTPESRERIFFSRRVVEFAGKKAVTKELVAKYLETVHLGFRPSENEVSAAFDFVTMNLKAPETLTPEFAIRMMLESMEKIAAILDGLCWTVESDRKARLITSDTPLVIWRQPSIRDAYEGVGVANAEEIRVALDPVKQLVLSRRQRAATSRIESARVRECNADVSSSCHRFIVTHPNNVNRAMATELAASRPVLRFNHGPLYLNGERQGDDVLQYWVPRRQQRP